jgi:hypothetical protein
MGPISPNVSVGSQRLSGKEKEEKVLNSNLLFMGPWAAPKKPLYASVVVLPAPVWVPSQWLLA